MSGIKSAALLTLLGLTFCLQGCKTTCPELKEKYADELDEIRRRCDCSFVIECDPKMTSGGVAGLTIRDATGRVLIKLPGGDREVSKDTLRHELVHAIDRCARLCENALPTPPADIGTRAEYIFIVRRALLCEFIAYRTTGVNEEERIDPNRFPNPDADDKAILSSYLSVGNTVTSTLPAEVRDELTTTLEAANLGAQQIRADSDEYRNLKRTLITEANRIQTAMKACLDLVLDL